MNRFSLKNKVAVVTGGLGFFGKQICDSLLELNCKVISLDINKTNARKGIKSRNFENVLVDITNEKQTEIKFQYIIKKYKKIDILVNNAAIDYKPKIKSKSPRFEETSLKNWFFEINVGLTGAFICSKLASKHMTKKKSGIILNIASDLSVIAPDQRLYSHMGNFKPVTYSVIKHGIVGLTKYLASYLAKHKIRVNCISPGGIENNQDKIFLKKIKTLIPLGRMANKNEYKEIIQFLCSDSSSYMTGQNIVIDGGRSII